MQRILQADGAQGSDLCLSGGEIMHHRQETEEPVPVLPVPEVLVHGDEERSGPGRGCRGGLPCSAVGRHQSLSVACMTCA